MLEHEGWCDENLTVWDMGRSVRRVQGSVQDGVGRLNCAGQSCPERKECRRFVTRIEGGHGEEHKHGRWGSFDIERLQQGKCLAFVRQQ